MCTYFIYSILKIISRATHNTTDFSADTDARIFDILSLLISISNMLMLYGVSDSIKKSVERQVRTERLTSVFEELMSNTEEGGSIQVDSLGGHEPDDLIEKHLRKQYS